MEMPDNKKRDEILKDLRVLLEFAGLDNNLGILLLVFDKEQSCVLCETNAPEISSLFDVIIENVGIFGKAYGGETVVDEKLIKKRGKEE